MQSLVLQRNIIMIIIKFFMNYMLTEFVGENIEEKT